MEGGREKNNLSLSFIYKYLSDLTIMIMTHFSYPYKLCITCSLMYQEINEINENSVSSHHAIKFDRELYFSLSLKPSVSN